MPGPQSADLPYVAIRCSTKRPADSLVAIEHRGHCIRGAWRWCRGFHTRVGRPGEEQPETQRLKQPVQRLRTGH